MSISTKNLLYQKCLDFVEQRIQHAQEAFDAATDAANNESKSTVGDKHETARAMAQLEQEKATKQINQAKEMQVALSKIDVAKTSERVVLGSLVITDKLTFFIAIAVGKVEVEGTSVFVISPASPIGQKLLGLSIGDTLEFNGQTYQIKQVI